ncbi:hypothetical protein [Halogeometricum luteum]|uniref:hypothetical protein n=1 Tax=Halogeometricum luteum TaxID=2950537 RepID=UPI003CCD71C7
MKATHTNVRVLRAVMEAHGVGVSGPTDRMSGKTLEEDITGLVVSTAKSIENDLL